MSDRAVRYAKAVLQAMCHVVESARDHTATRGERITRRDLF